MQKPLCNLQHGLWMEAIQHPLGKRMKVPMTPLAESHEIVQRVVFIGSRYAAASTVKMVSMQVRRRPTFSAGMAIPFTRLFAIRVEEVLRGRPFAVVDHLRWVFASPSGERIQSLLGDAIGAEPLGASLVGKVPFAGGTANRGSDSRCAPRRSPRRQVAPVPLTAKRRTAWSTNHVVMPSRLEGLLTNNAISCGNLFHLPNIAS